MIPHDQPRCLRVRRCGVKCSRQVFARVTPRRTGLAVGLLAHPPQDRWRSAVALAAGFALAGFVILRILVQLRLPPGSPTTVLPWLIGPVVVLLVQSILVALLWRRRTAG